MTDDEHDDETITRPSEQRLLQRRQAKQEGRSRRAEMLVDVQTKERARQEQLEGRQIRLEDRIARLEVRLSRLEKTVQTTVREETKP